MESVRHRIGSIWHQLFTLPVLLRDALLGAAAVGTIGGLTGLVLGLRAHPATAWFAVLEVALPAALLGGLLGSLVGLLSMHHARRRGSTSAAA